MFGVLSLGLDIAEMSSNDIGNRKNVSIAYYVKERLMSPLGLDITEMSSKDAKNKNVSIADSDKERLTSPTRA